MTLPFLDSTTFLSSAGRLRTAHIPAADLGLSAGVWVRELTGSERERIQSMANAKVKQFQDGTQEIDMSNMSRDTMATIAVFTLIEPKHPAGVEYNDQGLPIDGDRIEYVEMFKRNQVTDLRNMSSTVLDAISKKVRELSGMTKSAIDEKKDD